MKINQAKDWSRLILIIILIVALGCWTINQFFGWYYKAELLKDPCKLCEDLNPQLEFRTKPSEINLSDYTELKLNVSIQK